MSSAAAPDPAVSSAAAPDPAGDSDRRTRAPFGRRLGAVVANEPCGPYRLLTVEDGDGPRDPRPGQFYMLATARGWGGLAGERPYLPRAFSFARVRRPARASGGATLDFLLEAIGPGTERLGGTRAGEEMWLTGPLGVGFGRPEAGERPLLVGGGIGVAPVLAWHDELGPAARVLLGFRSAAHAEAARLFDDAARLATDDGSAGRHGLVTELLREELDATPGALVYACGPPAMLEGVRAICAERDVRAQLALESGMACGFGACFGCTVATRHGYVRVCLDGPVLDAGELETALTPGAGH